MSSSQFLMLRPRSVAVVIVPAGRFPFPHPPLGDDHDHPPASFYHVDAFHHGVTCWFSRVLQWIQADDFPAAWALRCKSVYFLF